MFSRKTLVLTSLFSLLFASFLWYNNTGDSSKYNHIKSQQLSFQHHSLRSTEKLRLPLKVNFEVLNGETEINKNMELQVSIIPLHHLQNIQVKWVISEEVLLLNSSLTSFTLDSLNVGQHHIWMADFRQNTNENQILNLYIEANIGETTMRAHYPFHSVNHTDIMKKAKDLKLRHEEYVSSELKKLKLRE